VRLREESGFTVVEAMVAGLLLVVGALGMLQVFDAGTRNTYRAEESQVLNNRLQAELERLEAIPYAELAMSSNPGHVNDSNDPRSRVSGTNFALASNGTESRPMVIDSEDGINPGPIPFETGDVSGEIYRFVVSTPDPACGTYCPGDEDLKRVVVAAKIDEAPVSFEHSYDEIQTAVVDPDATPVDNPGPPDEEEEGASAEFWLTDTPCSSPTRQPITQDHTAHNTRATCSEGLQTGTTPGAPDLMFTEAPPLDPNYPPGDQPLVD
jgi:hypothetical protein